MTQKALNFVVRYFAEVREEMKKVTWPTKKQVQNSTLIVIAISLGMAMFFGGLDYVLNILFEKLINL